MNKKYEWIINYLKENKGWVSPTKIGIEYGKTVGKKYHSSWASPKCLKLTEMNLIIRNEDGHYAYPHEYIIDVLRKKRNKYKNIKSVKE